MSDCLFVVIPAYNESANLETLIREWYPVVESHNEEGRSRMVIVNDGSRDRTLEILREQEKTHPLLTALDKENGGHGSAVLYGYRYALSQHADWIFQTDSDGQTNPNELEAFWQARTEYDAVIGNRSARQDGSSRIFVEKVLLGLLRVIFGVKMPDSNAPFRLMRASLVEKYLRRMPENYNLPNVMLTTFFVYYHERVTFLPISFKPRQGGENSINLRKITGIGLNAIRDFLTFRREMRQLKL